MTSLVWFLLLAILSAQLTIADPPVILSVNPETVVLNQRVTFSLNSTTQIKGCLFSRLLSSQGRPVLFSISGFAPEFSCTPQLSPGDVVSTRSNIFDTVAVMDSNGDFSNWFPISLQGRGLVVDSISPNSFPVDRNGRVQLSKAQQKIEVMVEDQMGTRVKFCKFGDQITRPIRTRPSSVTCRLPEALNVNKTKVDVSLSFDGSSFFGGMNGMSVPFKYEVVNRLCSQTTLCNIGQVCNQGTCEPQTQEVLVFSTSGKCATVQQPCFDQNGNTQMGFSTSLIEAVENSQSGQKIIVDDGVYCGGFTIDKPYITLQSRSARSRVSKFRSHQELA